MYLQYNLYKIDMKINKSFPLLIMHILYVTWEVNWWSCSVCAAVTELVLDPQQPAA